MAKTVTVRHRGSGHTRQVPAHTVGYWRSQDYEPIPEAAPSKPPAPAAPPDRSAAPASSGEPDGTSTGAAKTDDKPKPKP